MKINFKIKTKTYMYIIIYGNVYSYTSTYIYNIFYYYIIYYSQYILTKIVACFRLDR